MTSGEDAEHHGSARLPAGSYTAQRLKHASAHHLHHTTKRVFIGPIPSAWIADHRKSWAKHRPRMLTYSSRTATFNAAENVSEFRSLIGLDGENLYVRRHGLSFPQPTDINNEEPDSTRAGRDVQEGKSTTVIRSSSPGQAESQALESIPSPSRKSELLGDTAIYVAAQTKQQDSRTFITAPEEVDSVNEDVNPQTYDRQHLFTRRTEKTDAESPLTFKDEAEPSATGRREGSSESTQALLSLDESEALSVERNVRDNREERPKIQTTSSITSKNAPRLQKSSSKRNVLLEIAPEAYQDGVGQANQTQVEQITSGTIRFKLPNDIASKGHRLRRRISEDRERVSGKDLRRSEAVPGQLLKAERMLVRIDLSKHEIEKDYSEKVSAKAEPIVLEKWREYMITCRRSNSEIGFILDMAKTRVLPMLADRQTSKKIAHRINLVPYVTRVNFFSTLDKTIVIWEPTKRGTRIFTFRPRSSDSAIEWFNFLNFMLGWKSPGGLKISIPDLDVMLEIDNPMKHTEMSYHTNEIDSLVEGDQQRKLPDDNLVGIIIGKALGSLKSSEFQNLLSEWQRGDERLGLAWRQYDRLDWVHGINEERMCGSLAMQQTHELEIRTKVHYPTFVTRTDGGRHDHLQEPAPVEGFLVRQTSQSGRNSLLGRNFFKRLYFSTHNHLLCFSTPGKAIPPKSKELNEALDQGSQDAKTLARKIPLIYTVNPYPLKDGKIAWMSESNLTKRKEHDQRAYEESQRSLHLILEAEGYINMCHINKVRKYKPKKAEIPEDAAETQDEDSQTDDENDDISAGIRHDIQRSFELHLLNGLIIRLQAYDKEARKEWVRRLRELSCYWKLRIAGDIDLCKEIRHQNLDSLGIDEEMESIVGQVAEKWEVSKSVASPALYHMCGISRCRQITVRTIVLELDLLTDCNYRSLAHYIENPECIPHSRNV